MTFEEWWKTSWWKSCAEKGDVFKVWQAATLAERERCEGVVQNILDNRPEGHWDNALFDALTDIIEAVSKGEGV